MANSGAVEFNTEAVISLVVVALELWEGHHPDQISSWRVAIAIKTVAFRQMNGLTLIVMR